LPLWEHLVVELGLYESRTNAGLDVRPVMVGRFQVRRKVGGGGMGTVFEAIDTELGRRVALKVCSYAGIDAVTAIEHEARCLAKLAHPNVVGIHEVVRYGGDVILVMEFVQGRTLGQWQRATKRSWRDVLDRYLEAGRGLAAAHDAGIVHGDFKPENVMLGDDGRVRVVDFGIARYSSSDRLDVTKMGTRSYMAPERLEEKPGGPRADLYAFCVAVWESLYGVLPFTGKTVPDLLNSIEAGTPARGHALPGLPESVRAVLRKGLSANPSERPPSMEALIRELDDACEGHRRRRVRMAQWVGGGLVTVLVVASTVMAWTLARESTVDRSLAEEPSPELGVIEQTLLLAEQEARDGDPDSAVQFLELAQSRARRDGDVDGLRRVAEAAVRAGESLRDRGQRKHALDCLGIAADVYFHVNDREAYLRAKAVLLRNR
jgi:predicted Ser/Thr protein kinase